MHYRIEVSLTVERVGMFPVFDEFCRDGGFSEVFSECSLQLRYI